MNTTKIYGADGNKFGHTDQDAIERFWRHLLGGVASGSLPSPRFRPRESMIKLLPRFVPRENWNQRFPCGPSIRPTNCCPTVSPTKPIWRPILAMPTLCTSRRVATYASTLPTRSGNSSSTGSTSTQASGGRSRTFRVATRDCYLLPTNATGRRQCCNVSSEELLRRPASSSSRACRCSAGQKGNPWRSGIRCPRIGPTAEAPGGRRHDACPAGGFPRRTPSGHIIRTRSTEHVRRSVVSLDARCRGDVRGKRPFLEHGRIGRRGPGPGKRAASFRAWT